MRAPIPSNHSPIRDSIACRSTCAFASTLSILASTCRNSLLCSRSYRRSTESAAAFSDCRPAVSTARETVQSEIRAHVTTAPITAASAVTSVISKGRTSPHPGQVIGDHRGWLPPCCGDGPEPARRAIPCEPAGALACLASGAEHLCLQFGQFKEIEHCTTKAGPSRTASSSGSTARSRGTPSDQGSDDLVRDPRGHAEGPRRLF